MNTSVRWEIAQTMNKHKNETTDDKTESTELGRRRPRDLSETARIDGIVGKAKARDTDHALTILEGRQEGRTVRLLGNAFKIGRDPSCDFPVLGRGISRSHLELKKEDSHEWVVYDADSKNGTFVNGEKVERRCLSPGDEIQIGLETVLKYSRAGETEVAVRVANYEASIRDPLTGIYNRRHFTTQLTYYVHEATRRREPLSILFLDIDHFKRVNDQYGHPAGDIVIKGVSDCVLEMIRPVDIFCRYGGEEFALIVDGADALDAYDVAERMRLRISRLSFRLENVDLPVTASFGLSTLAEDETRTVKELIEEADRNLYEAKRDGRNRTARTK